MQVYRQHLQGKGKAGLGNNLELSGGKESVIWFLSVIFITKHTHYLEPRQRRTYAGERFNKWYAAGWHNMAGVSHGRPSGESLVGRCSCHLTVIGKSASWALRNTILSPPGLHAPQRALNPNRGPTCLNVFSSGEFRNLSSNNVAKSKDMGRIDDMAWRKTLFRMLAGTFEGDQIRKVKLGENKWWVCCHEMSPLSEVAGLLWQNPYVITGGLL